MIRMSQRELDVCQLVRSGMSNLEIAKSFGVSVNTVKSHIANSLRKSGLHSRAGLRGPLHMDNVGSMLTKDQRKRMAAILRERADQLDPPGNPMSSVESIAKMMKWLEIKP